MARRSKPQGSKKNPKSKNMKKSPDNEYFKLMFNGKEKAVYRAMTKPGTIEILRNRKKACTALPMIVCWCLPAYTQRNGKHEAWGEVSFDVFPYQYAYDPEETIYKVSTWAYKEVGKHSWEGIIKKANAPDPEPPSYAFSCPGCNEGFNTEIELIDHYVAITGWGCLEKSWTNPAPDERRPCPVPKCNTKVRNFEKFKEHCFSAHWKWKQCAECNSHLPDATQLKRHKATYCKPLASHPDLVEDIMTPKNQSKRGASDDLDYQPLDSQRGASTRPAKRQRLPRSHQSATEPVARRTRAGRVTVASTSTAQPEFNLPEETSTEWSEVPQLTLGTTSDEEVPETPPLSPVRLPRSRQRFAMPVVESDGDVPELDERDASSGDECQDARDGDDESQRSADEQAGSADDAEAIDDEFQGPAGKSELQDVPEDDVEDVPLKASEEKSAEILRKVAAPHLKAIQAMVSLDRDCEIIYYTMDYDRNGGSVKTNIAGYKRHVTTLWSPMAQLQKAYRHVLLDRVCQEVHLTRRFIGLRRTGYLHETLKEHLHKDLINASVTLDVNRSDLGIVPDETSVFFGQAFTWTTALGQKRQGSDHEATLIPEMSQIKEIECDPPPNYVLLSDSVTMSKLLGDSHFPQRYASELGCGLVGGLRGNSSYNERCWAYALSQKYPNAIFAMISDWDPYSFDNYLTLRRGAPAFAPENPHLAIPRLIHIGPTYEDLNSNNAIVPLDTKDGQTRAKNLLAYPNLPSELKPEVQKMHEQVIRAQADKCRNPVKFAAARLLELRKSNTLWPESGNLGVLHIPIPNHDEDFELDLGAVVPADVVFHQDDELGHTDADNRRTILERCGEEFTISKYNADGELTDRVESNLELAQQLVEPEREKIVAQRLKVAEEILMDYDATKDRASKYFKILEDRAAYFQMLIPPPPERVVRPLRPGNVWKNGEPGPEFRTLGRAALYDAFFFRDIPLKKIKNKLASTRKAAPPVDSVSPPSDVPTKPAFNFKCERCGDKFVDKVAYEGHLKLNAAKCLQPAPHPASRPSTPFDEAGEEHAESTSSLECTACEGTFDSPEARDSHLRTKEGWECVLAMANPRQMGRNMILYYECCMCRRNYDCYGIPGLERHWKMFHSDESKSKYQCEDCLVDYKGKVNYHAHIIKGVCGETGPNCFFPGCTHEFPNSDPEWLKKYAADHYRVHTTPTTACPACHKNFDNLEKLEHHLTINKETRVKCGEQVREKIEGKSS